MTTTHTPGPWQYDEAGRGTYMVFPSADTEGSALVCSNIKREEDARLLACAPDLLAALTELGNAAAPGMPSDPTWVAAAYAKARAAIARATGN